MSTTFITLTLVLAVVIFVGAGYLIKWLGRIPFYWKSTPANTFSVIVTDEDGSGDGMTGGGPIVTVLHGIGGHKLDKTDIDPMNWPVIPGQLDPEHDSFLFRKFGLQPMGSIYYTARLNDDSRMRFTREKKTEDEKKPGVVSTTTTEMPKTVMKVNHTHNVFYSGELTVSIKEADTKDKLGLDFEIDFSFRRKFPVRSVLRLANGANFLTSLVEQIVNNETVGRNAEEYIGGEETKANRETLARLIASEIHDSVEREIGFDIVEVSIRDVSMKADHRKLLERKIDAEKRAEVTEIDAEAAKKSTDET